jgi:hypothetical protein
MFTKENAKKAGKGVAGATLAATTGVVMGAAAPAVAAAGICWGLDVAGRALFGLKASHSLKKQAEIIDKFLADLHKAQDDSRGSKDAFKLSAGNENKLLRKIAKAKELLVAKRQLTSDEIKKMHEAADACMRSDGVTPRFPK